MALINRRAISYLARPFLTNGDVHEQRRVFQRFPQIGKKPNVSIAYLNPIQLQLIDNTG